jgi:hypothetical protein
MEKIANALMEGIRRLGLEVILAPQSAASSCPRIELYLAGIESAGLDHTKPQTGNVGWERITFTAVFKGEGTHSRWVTEIMLALRKLLALNEDPMPLTVKADKTYQLKACWKRQSAGSFEYPEEGQSSMPVRYVEPWEVSIAYPAHIIGLYPADNPKDGQEEAL